MTTTHPSLIHPDLIAAERPEVSVGERVRFFISENRGVCLTILVLILVLVPEVAVRLLSPTKCTVEIVNQGKEPMTQVRVSYRGSKIVVGDVPPGGLARVHFTPGPMEALRIELNQPGNPVQLFEIADFEPARLVEDDFKQVIEINGTQLGRSVEDDEGRRSPIGRLLAKMQGWLDAHGYKGIRLPPDQRR